MTGKTPPWLLPATIVGIVLGLGLGYVQPELMSSLAPLGKLYLNALLFLSLLLIPAALISSLAGFGDLAKAGKFAGKAAGLLLGTGVISVVVAVGLSLVFAPGQGVTVSAANQWIPAESEWLLGPNLADSIWSFLPHLSLFWLVAFTIVFAIALSQLRLRDRTLLGISREFQMAVLGTASALTRLAPLGLLLLVGGVVAQFGIDGLGSMLTLLFVCLLSFVLIAFLIVPAVTMFFSKQSPWASLPHLLPVMATAFGTGSSVSLLPASFETLTRDAGRDPRATGLSLPLSAVLNISLQAAYVTILSLFALQVLQINAGIDTALLIALLSMVCSIGLPGLPGTAVIVTGVILLTTGRVADPNLLVSALGAIAIVDWLLDRVKAACTVWLDANAVVAIGSMEELSTPRRSNREFEDRRPEFRNRDSRREFDPNRRDRFNQSRPNRRTEESSPFAMAPSSTPVLDGEKGNERTEERSSGHRPERHFRNDRSERPRSGEPRGERGFDRGRGRYDNSERRDRNVTPAATGDPAEASAPEASTMNGPNSSESGGRPDRPFRDRDRSGRDRRGRDRNDRSDRYDRRDRSRGDRPQHRWSESGESNESPESHESGNDQIESTASAEFSFDLSGNGLSEETTTPAFKSSESADDRSEISTEESGGATIGRGRSEHRDRYRPSPEKSEIDVSDASEPEDQSAPSDRFSTDGASFGRGRRKRGGR